MFTKHRTTIFVLSAILALSGSCTPDRSIEQERPEPFLGKSLRYCNPLSIEASSEDGSARGVSLGDVTIVLEEGRYYMFCTGGGGWISEDLVNWEYRGVEMREGRVPVAPHVVKYNGEFYMSGNNAPLYKAPGILGPYEKAGDWTVASGEPWTGESNGRPWTGAFDVDIFIDDDNKPYLYFPGRSTDGIYVVALDPKDLSRFATEPVRLIGFDSSHTWERYGDMNEYPDVSWIEGPWMMKRNGTYYLQYNASGTQWLTYATGVYTSKSPTGPFVYAPVNPILRKTMGVVTGPGHGCIVEGPDGNLWQFYTIVLANPPGGRRLGMDPAGFDPQGNLYVNGPSETPRWGPGAVQNPAGENDPGSLPLTVNKMRAMNAKSGFTSQRPGYDAAYAIDNSAGTWWEPEEGDAQPAITIDLGPATEFDPVQMFTVDSSRILFATGGAFWFGGRQIRKPDKGAVIAFQYRIEASRDGETYETILDKTGNAVTKYIEFDELPPTTCRFIRLTITDWPGTGDRPLGIVEFTVFGKAVEPAAME
ncbi:MAG: family 43 glycosylhydrolase [Acidobacteria bacterium]|nr:family 43 glycosylhydrolase [Acidobacteriota bacterium]